MATERSLERCGVERFDLLLLHNPDRTGYSSPAVWEGMESVRAAGLTRLLGVAPGPANGFTLDLIDCIERFAEVIDWAMIILNPLEPWPGELVLDAAVARGVELITRVVDYGGIFHDDVLPGHAFAEYDHRRFRPDGWVMDGREKLELMRPYAERHGLTRALRGSDTDPGERTRRAPGRGQARGARRAGRRRRSARRGDAEPRGGACDPRDRREHGLYGAEGCEPRTRGAPAA
jgi:hypothetical protein